MSVLSADFQITQGEFSLQINCNIDSPITGVFGPSGAGKTTFLQAIAGLVRPDCGEIQINNQLVFSTTANKNLPPEKRKIGYVFQEGRLFPHMTVAQNLQYGSKKNINVNDFREIIQLLKIEELLYKKPGQISGGQAQRVAIGRAILSSPQLLVLDEPFSALEKSLRQHIISLLKPLIAKFNIPLIVISHELSDLLMLSEQLLILNKGKCLGHGSYYDLINQKTAVSELSKSGLINSIDLKVDYVDGERGMMILSNNGIIINAESLLRDEQFLDSADVIAFLRPEDITLASHEIKDISMQNQLKGTIENIIVSENKVLVVVDNGVKLVAEVTVATMQKMKLKKGMTIWSLFKAAAVKMNSPGIVNSQ